MTQQPDQHDNPQNFQFGAPDQIIPWTTPADRPPDPPRGWLSRWWNNPPRRLALLLIGGLLIVLAALLLMQGDDPMPVKEFDAAAAALGVEPVEEWVVHELDAATIRLPKRLDLLDVDPDLLVQMSGTALGPEWSAVIGDAAGSDNLIGVQVFFDRVGGLPGGVTLNVVAQKLPRRMSPQQAADEIKQTHWPSGVRQIDAAAVVELGGVEVTRHIVEVNYDDVGPIRMVQFMVLDNDAHLAWIVSGTSPTESFEDWLAIFSAAAGTIKHSG